MKRRGFFVFLLVLAAHLSPDTVLAHVPYFEHRDFTWWRPFQVRNSIEQSIAVYSWIQFDGSHPARDVDFYVFDVEEPTVVYVESIVPVCPEYEQFLPWFAVIGPGFPEPEYDIPVNLPPGYGAIVVPNSAPGEPRSTFYEFFGGKSYYQGPTFEAEVCLPGRYYVIYWDPYEMGGDYVAVLGNKEIWGFLDIIRALIYTPMIRRGLELHSECPSPLARQEKGATSIKPCSIKVTPATSRERRESSSRPNGPGPARIRETSDRR